ITERQSAGTGVANIAPILSIVDLGDAVLVVVDGVAAAALGVSEDGIALRIGASLGGSCGHDGDPREAQHLHEGGHGAVADRDLDLLVVVPGRRDHRDGIAATLVGDGISGRTFIYRVALRIGRRLVEDRQRVLYGVIQVFA